MWAIGQKLKLIQSALPEKDDTKYKTTNKRNVMTVAVSRYLSQTSRMVENTSLGRFPDSTTVNKFTVGFDPKSLPVPVLVNGQHTVYEVFTPWVLGL